MNIYHAIIDDTKQYADELVDFIKSYKGSKDRKIINYIIAFEVSKKTGKEHYHCTFQCDTPLTTIRRHFKAFFTKKLNSVTTARDKETVFLYTVKDGNVIAHTYPEEQVESWKKASYKKPESEMKKSRNFYNDMKQHILRDESLVFTEREIGKAVLRYYHSKCKCFPFTRQLNQYIESIKYAHLGRTNAVASELYLDKLLDKALLDY